MSGKRQKQILSVGKPLQVPAGEAVSLVDDFEPGDPGEVKGKKQGKKLLKQAVKLISGYQRRLAAEEDRRILFVIQALDAGGSVQLYAETYEAINATYDQLRPFVGGGHA